MIETSLNDVAPSYTFVEEMYEHRAIYGFTLGNHRIAICDVCTFSSGLGGGNVVSRHKQQ